MSALGVWSKYFKYPTLEQQKDAIALERKAFAPHPGADLLKELEHLRKVRDAAQNLLDNDLCHDLCNKYESRVCSDCAGHKLEQVLSQGKSGGE